MLLLAGGLQGLGKQKRSNYSREENSLPPGDGGAHVIAGDQVFGGFPSETNRGGTRGGGGVRRWGDSALLAAEVGRSSSVT